MSESRSSDLPAALLLSAGADHFGEQRGLDISTIAFKVTPPNPGDPLILENTFLARGDPARHLHYEQEEWFYILEGKFLFEVGAERFHLRPGESLHAGNMEAFFREVTKANSMPPQDPALWRTYGMELLGTPLPVA